MAAESGWNESALQGVFLKGLSDEDQMKDELAARDETSSLEELISLATRLDNRLRERRRERCEKQRATFNSSTLRHCLQLAQPSPIPSRKVTSGRPREPSLPTAPVEEPMLLVVKTQHG